MHTQCSDKKGGIKHIVNKVGTVKILCEMKIRQ